MVESMLEYGIVTSVNEIVGDVLVVDNKGNVRWWPQRRWRILSYADKERNMIKE